MAQSNTGSDWNWFLIFVIVVVVLAIALIIQAKISGIDAAELEHHEEVHHEEEELVPGAVADSVGEPEPEPKAASEPQESTTPPETAVENPVEPDDLKKLEGIGPKVASLLNENGITTFAQLAETPVEKLDEILEANKLQMMHPGSWPQQAKLAAAGDWDALEKLQGELQGGR